jgi:hypothetical protein
MKSYADESNKAKESQLKMGDVVLVKIPKENKLSTPFSPQPYLITEKKGTQITVKNNSHSITRNSSHFKKTEASPDIVNSKSSAHSEEEEIYPSNHTETNEMSLDDEEPALMSPKRPSRVIKTPAYLNDYDCST